jgi:hypothetical protein
MKRWLWVQGRFSWSFVAAIVIVSLALVLADIAWRLLIMPLETMLFFCGMAGLIVAIGLGVIARNARRE